MPSDMTVGWTGSSSSPHDMWHGRNILFLSFFRKTTLAVSWLLNRIQFPQCPEEHRLRHPKKLDFCCKRFLWDFLKVFLFEQFPQKFRNSFSSTPPTVRCFPMTQEWRKRLTKTTLRTFASTWSSSGRQLDSSGTRIPQEFGFFKVPVSSRETPVSSMFLNILGGRQWWLNLFFRDFSPVYTHKHISPLTVLSSILQNLKGGTRCTYNLPLFGNLMTIRLKLQRGKYSVLEVLTWSNTIPGYRRIPPEDVHI